MRSELTFILETLNDLQIKEKRKKEENIQIELCAWTNSHSKIFSCTWGDFCGENHVSLEKLFNENCEEFDLLRKMSRSYKQDMVSKFLKTFLNTSRCNYFIKHIHAHQVSCRKQCTTSSFHEIFQLSWLLLNRMGFGIK